jgi:hypothetical protein
MAADSLVAGDSHLVVADTHFVAGSRLVDIPPAAGSRLVVGHPLVGSRLVAQAD